MPNSSASLSLLSVISLLSFFVVLLTNKFSYKIKNGALLDIDFNKPQAFHQNPTARSGGLASFISLSLFFVQDSTRQYKTPFCLFFYCQHYNLDLQDRSN